MLEMSWESDLRSAEGKPHFATNIGMRRFGIRTYALNRLAEIAEPCVGGVQPVPLTPRTHGIRMCRFAQVTIIWSFVTSLAAEEKLGISIRNYIQSRHRQELHQVCSTETMVEPCTMQQILHDCCIPLVIDEAWLSSRRTVLPMRHCLDRLICDHGKILKTGVPRHPK